ncbi:MAG: putative peptide maturation dehydrogenase [Gammaproteobacteria bacterium RIFCSPHIGHO2_12_FULL_63_22]|nr:MAG: putative peptide maturation dehydrogenase [Gammaproteobacteria bacterium RIFCSPHIGHO2_12_FULL_63_22]
MILKRPTLLLIERAPPRPLSMQQLLSKDDSASGWRALAPHLGHEVPLQLADLAVFDALAEDEAASRADLSLRFGTERIDYLVDSGLLIGDHADHEPLRLRDRLLKDTGWWTPAAVAHSFGRWQGIDVDADQKRVGKRTLGSLIRQHGPPPPEALELRARQDWLVLPAARKTALDKLLVQRTTCRNFDPEHRLPAADLASLMHRVFAAQATQELAPGAVALKKNSPSGGGLHPIEAYLLVQRVEGVPPGLYHYHSTGHALQVLGLPDADQIAAMAKELVAGQAWFANAPVLVLMAARFKRNFWKYRNHAKAWRVIQLDAGHLSQNLYLTATEMGYGAFITGAINDECAERLFELDGLSTGAIAVCGFGRRIGPPVAVEFDPLGKAVR